LPGIRDVKQSAPHRFLVIADDAGAATPRVLNELRAAGVEVLSSSEYRPSFDEVFASLVSRFDRSSPLEEEVRNESDRRRVARAA